MAFRFPFGTIQELNLDWFLEQWEIFKAEAETALGGIDHALQAEIDRVEAAMTDLYAARDAAAASADRSAAQAGYAYDYAQSANRSAGQAAEYWGNAAEAAGNAIKWATGAGTQEGDPQFHNNALYYAGEAGTHATAAENYKNRAEAWATGKINGVDVPTTDETHENNSAYYCSKAKDWYDATEELVESLPEDFQQILDDYNALMPILQTDVLTGDVVTFESPVADTPLKKLVANIVAARAGDGDPSPDNVRAISGYTGMNIYRNADGSTDNPNYVIAFPANAGNSGTVYGGYVTLNADGSATLTVTHVMYSLGGRGYNTTYANLGVYRCSLVNMNGVISNMYKYAGVYTATAVGNMPNYSVARRNAYPADIYVRDNRYINYTSDQFSAAMTAAGAYVVLTRQTPIIYDLTPQQVTVLLGTNVIQTDTGPVEVTTGGYFGALNDSMQDAVHQPEIAGVVCANIETSDVASKNYAINDFFILNGELYKVTAVIAQNGQIEENSNCVKTTIAAEITALLNT